MGCALAILIATLCISGCAVSGCGNPVTHNDIIDSNNSANEETSVVLKSRECLPLQSRMHRKHQIKREKIKARYSRDY